MTQPLGNLRLHRWDLTIANAETFTSGLENIVDYALKTDITNNDEVGISTLTAAGVFTFDVGAGGATNTELLVWTT